MKDNFQTASNSNIFKFNLQEEKFNQLKNISYSSGLYPEKNKLGDKYQPLEGSAEVENLNVDSNIKNKNTFDTFQQKLRRKSEFDYEYLIMTTEHFKKEISDLKSYINRLNKEMRKKLNVEIPILDRVDYNKTDTQHESREENFSELLKYFSDSFERLLNPEYLNPIFIQYDNLIQNLEKELNFHKNLSVKYEKKIIELVQENQNLRETNLLKSNELKELLKTKVENNSVIPFDEEFFRHLEERNDILSKENEILAMNYQKLSQEFVDFNLSFSQKHIENLKKIEIYDKLEEELKRLKFILEDVMTKNKIYENKFMELTGEFSKTEIEKNNYMILCDKFRADNANLIEANMFYKNYLNKSV